MAVASSVKKIIAEQLGVDEPDIKTPPHLVDDLGADAPPGFGVRFVGLSDDARSLIATYAGARAPMLLDDA